MKTFVYTEERRPNRVRNNRVLRIYRIINNAPKFLGSLEYTTGSTPGSDSEVFQWLINNGYVPKKYYNLSRSESRGDWCGAGYYCPEVEAKGIKIIELY